MHKREKIRFFATVGFVLLVATCLFAKRGLGPTALLASRSADAVGLSLFFENGQIQPITLIGDAPRFLQEIDISATVTTTTDEGIAPVIRHSEFSTLDWSGVM